MLPHENIEFCGVGMDAAGKVEQEVFHLEIVAGGILGSSKQAAEATSAYDVDIEDGDVTAIEPITRDP